VSIEKAHNPVVGRIFFALMMVPALLMGQDRSGFTARPAEPRLETVQGNVLAASIVVANTGRAPVTLKGTLILPKGWRPVLREPGFTLKAGQSDTRLVSFSLPRQTAAGRYEVRYHLTDASDSSKAADAVIEVVVRAVRHIDAQVLRVPRFVIAGRDYAVLFHVSNSGNITGRVRLTVKNSDDFRVRLDSTRLWLGPRESRTVTALVMTRADLPGKIVNTLELYATLAGDSTVSARVSSVIDVIPQVEDVKDRYLEVPLQASVRAAGEADRIGAQVEVLGSGVLNETRTSHVELMLRTPDIQSQSSLALRDEYRIHYRSSHAEAVVGDYSYSLSPLTELSRFAFGGGGSVTLAGITAGGYVNRSRFFAPHQQQAAGFLNVEPIEGYRVGVNYLRKKDLQESGITTVRGVFNPVRAATLDMEYGVSDAAGLRDNAVSVRVSGHQEWGNLDVRMVQAGAHYTGYYRDLNYTSATMNLSPMQNFHLEGYYRDEERNKNRDTTLFFAPKERAMQIGAGYSNLISIYYRTGTQDDLLPVPQYRRTERVGQLRLGYALGTVDLFSNVDVGTVRDRLANKDFPFQRYALYTGFSPSSRQVYNVSLEYSTEQNLYTGKEQDRFSASLGATISISRETNILATAFYSRAYAPTKQDFGLVDVSLQHVFPFRHRLSVRARQTYLGPPLQPSELAYMIQYSVPLAVPVKRLTASGQVRGTVMDQNGKGIANVLLNAGASACITDADGEFFFPSLSPGEVYLTIDKATIGLDRIALQPTPMVLTIAGGEEKQLNITVVRSCKVTGTVSLFEFGETDSAGVVDAGPKSGVFIELTNGSEIQRRVTDARGQFVIADLRPGPWKLSVTGGAIPEYHYVDRTSVDLNLVAGQHQKVDFNLLPRRRKIRIIQQGVVQQEVLKTEPPTAPSQEEPCLISYDSKLRGFILQVSSWLTRGKATERARVAEEVTGQRSWVERVNVPELGIRYRVFVGPFKSRMEAEVYCRQLRALEMQ